MSYSREDETVADKLSVRYLKKAGYDPEAVIRMIDKMSDKHRTMPIRQYSAFKTHPYLSERKAAVKKEIYGRMDFVDFINAPAALGEQ
jgi:predicted Zn-dependent protease